MKTTYEGLRQQGKVGDVTMEFLPLDARNHQKIVEKCYGKFPDLPDPEKIIQYFRLQDVFDDTELDVTTLVFIDGGVTERPINLGNAVVVIDGGIVRNKISCGILFAETEMVIVEPVEKLRKEEPK